MLARTQLRSSSVRLTFSGPILVLLLATPLAAQESGSHAPSLAELQATATRDSNDAVALYRLAMGYWGREKWDDAERMLGQALKVAPNYADAHLALGVLPGRRGDGYWKDRIKREGIEKVREEIHQSFSHYRRAFLLNPLVDLGVLSKFEESGEISYGGAFVFSFAPWWMHDLTKSANELREGQYDTTFERLQELAHDRRFGGEDIDVASDVLWLHGLAAAHVKNYDMAVRDFAILTGRSVAMERDTLRAERVSPMQSNDYRFILATMLYLAGRYDQAIPTFRRALEVDLGLYVAHVQLARMYETRGDLEAALAERRLALDVQQDDPDLLIDLARTLLKTGRFEETRQPLADAARLNPRDARAPYLQAVLRQAREANPRNVRALHVLGIVSSQVGSTDEAREALTRFLAMAPSRFSEQKAEATRRLQELK